MSDKSDKFELKKIRAKTIILDTDFLDDPKVLKLTGKFGVEGLGMFLRLITAMGREGGYSPLFAAIELGTAVGVEQDRFIEFIKFCIEINLLSEKNGYVFSERLITDASRLDRKRKSWRRSQRASRMTHIGVMPLSEPEQEQEYVSNLDLKKELKKKTKSKGGEGGKSKPEKIEVAERVWLTSAETEKLIATYGQDYYAEAVEKLSNWIGMNPNADRVRNGKNAAYTFRAWVLRAVGEDRKKQTDNLNWLNVDLGGAGGSGSIEKLLSFSSNSEGTGQKPGGSNVVATTAKRIA